MKTFKVRIKDTTVRYRTDVIVAADEGGVRQWLKNSVTNEFFDCGEWDYEEDQAPEAIEIAEITRVEEIPEGYADFAPWGGEAWDDTSVRDLVSGHE